MSLINRQPFIDTFADAAEWGEHDELPVLPEETDPQIYGSRNTTAQPFYLVCEKDTLIVLMSGAAEVKLKHADVNRFKAVAGDFVYIPARTPHRVLPSKETIQYRYKAKDAGHEAVIWYCDQCDTVLHSHRWDTATTNTHLAYEAASTLFNESVDARTCKTCGHIHEPVNLAGVRWGAIGLEVSKGMENSDV